MKLFPDLTFAPKNNLTIHMIDVGQGLCIGVNLPNGDNVVIDTGDNSSLASVDRYIAKVLLRHSKTLNHMIISHPDSDHSGNVLDLFTKYHPTNVYIPHMITELEDGSLQYFDSYYSFFNTITSDKSVNIDYNFAGKVLNLGGVKFTWLAPNRDYYASSNDYSAVILIEYLDFSMLVTGDIGHNTGQENKVNTEMEVMTFASILGIDTDIDVLQIAHHGSKYSTNLEFLEYFTPEVALISVSEDNSYGHPADEIFYNMQEYDDMYNKDLLSNTYTTMSDNNIVISVDAESNYVIRDVGNIHDYLFISFIIVDILIFSILVFKLIDYVLGYLELRRMRLILFHLESDKK